MQSIKGGELMKKIILSVLLTVALVGFIQAQNNKNACGSVEDLSDAQKFEKAIRCKNDIKENQQHPLYPIKSDSSPVYVVHLSESSCNKFKNEDLWVTLLSELQDVYKSKPAEFGQLENRLKKLIGLKEKDTYRCLTILQTSFDSLEQPSKGEPDYPFTKLGFTCDWYYGDGCRYGLREFTLKKKAEKIISYEINNCSIENLLGEKCQIH
jgi:hypothetical protein